jgi:DNA-binding transcriptional regulator YiaG
MPTPVPPRLSNISPAAFCELVDAAGLTTGQLASIFDIDRRLVRDWLSGHRKVPATIVATLNLIVEWLDRPRG